MLLYFVFVVKLYFRFIGDDIESADFCGVVVVLDVDSPGLLECEDTGWLEAVVGLVGAELPADCVTSGFGFAAFFDF